MLELFLVGCGNNVGTLNNYEQNNVLNTSEAFSMGKVDFMETELEGVDWDKIEYSIDPKEIKILANGKPISTREDALSIGKAIIENCWSNNKFSDYVLLMVVHSTSDNIWCFDYSIDQRDKDINDLIDCGGFHVAIDGDNCELIKAWVDE